MIIDDRTLSIIKNKMNQLAPVPDKEFSAFTALLSKVSYKKNEFFVKAGDYPCPSGLVLQGLFRLFYIDLEGKEYTKNFMLPGQFAAPLNSILR